MYIRIHHPSIYILKNVIYMLHKCYICIHIVLYIKLHKYNIQNV